MTWPIWLTLVCVLAAVLAALVAVALGRLTLPGREAAGQTQHPPVPLPPEPHAEDVELVRFSLDVPGYERGQVDQAMDLLAARLRAQEAQIARLQARFVGDRVSEE